MKIKTLLMSLALSTSAFADDATLPVINVRGVDPGSFPINTEIQLYGGDAKVLFNSLPATKMWNDEESADWARKYRNLSIASPGYEVYLSCRKYKWENDHEVLLPEVQCSFGVWENNIDLATFNHEPSLYPQLPAVVGLRGIDPAETPLPTVVKVYGQDVHALNRMLQGASTTFRSPGNMLKLTCDADLEEEACFFKVNHR